MTHGCTSSIWTCGWWMSVRCALWTFVPLPPPRFRWRLMKRRMRGVEYHVPSCCSCSWASLLSLLLHVLLLRPLHTLLLSCCGWFVWAMCALRPHGRNEAVVLSTSLPNAARQLPPAIPNNDFWPHHPAYLSTCTEAPTERIAYEQQSPWTDFAQLPLREERPKLLSCKRRNTFFIFCTFFAHFFIFCISSRTSIQSD